MLLSPPIVVYSPRVLPVYVYDAHADCGQNVRFVLKISSIFMFIVEYLSQPDIAFSILNKICSIVTPFKTYFNVSVLHSLCFMVLPWQLRAGVLLRV